MKETKHNKIQPPNSKASAVHHLLLEHERRVNPSRYYKKRKLKNRRLVRYHGCKDQRKEAARERRERGPLVRDRRKN